MAAKTGLPANFANEGQRALHKSGVKQAIVCEKLKKPRSTVADWFGGKSKPNDTDSARLESWLGITPSMFRQGCGSPEPPPLPAKHVAKALANLAAQPHETKAAVDFVASGRTDGLGPEIDRLREMTAQPNLAPRDRASALSAIGRLLSKQTEIDCAAADLEHGWAKSESFRALCRAVYDALGPWPEALAAVRAALED
jgi:hypothetical protein